MPLLGPYRFSDEDVLRTVGATAALFDLLVDGLDDARSVVAEHRSRAEAAIASSEHDAAILAEVWSQWRAAMAAVRATGELGPRQEGTVSGLFTSDGGVPKAPRETVDVDFGGVVGDRQSDRSNHGRPWQALCVWSTEVIDGFRAAGHPLAPGLAGENVSVTGLSWERVRPGVLLQFGGVVAEVGAYSVPCKKNAPWFVDGHFDLMHHRHGPVSRVYATVVQPGSVAVGDPAVLNPAPA